MVGKEEVFRFRDGNQITVDSSQGAKRNLGIRRTREQLGKENKGIGRDKIVSEENNKRTKILGS